MYVLYITAFKGHVQGWELNYVMEVVFYFFLPNLLNYYKYVSKNQLNKFQNFNTFDNSMSRGLQMMSAVNRVKHYKF